MVSIRIYFAKVVIDGVKRMNGILAASETERDVEILATGHRPVLVFGVIHGSLNTTIDCIGHRSGNLTSAQTASVSQEKNDFTSLAYLNVNPESNTATN